MMRYSYDVFHTAGKNLVLADTLSRQPLPQTGPKDLEEAVSSYVNMIVSTLSASDEKLSEIWLAQQQDKTLQKIASFTMNGWPKIEDLDNECKLYWQAKEELAVADGLLLRDCRLVIPRRMREEILYRLHAGHQGIVKCRARARESVWWPKISEEIQEMIRRCSECVKEKVERHEPLIPSEFPERPWQKVACDLFHFKGKWYLVMTDYYSRFPEIALLEKLDSSCVIVHCKSFFARHGVPELVRSDNGPQFKVLKSSEFTQFAKTYGFIHTTSSPRFPQSNGFVEAAVKIVKNLLKKNADPYVALLEYRATPLANGYSPAELLMGRRIRSTLPMLPSRYNPYPVNQDKLLEKEERRRDGQRRNYDQRHGVRSKEDFTPGEVVWIKDLRIWGTVKTKDRAPRSYIVATDRGEFRRNSFHLTRAYRMEDPEERSRPLEVRQPQAEEAEKDAQHFPYRTRSGRIVKPKCRLNL